MTKILVVDDAKLIRDELSKVFLKEGYEVLQAENGSDGVAIVKANTDLDMIITDLNMPEMDGLSMIEKIREEVPDFDQPILILTTEASPNLKQRGRMLGVKLWAIKPVSPASLLGPMRKLLGL